MRSAHTLLGFVDTAVGMHDGVPDVVDARSGRIMELRDGRGMKGSARRTQEGPGDQVFSINSGGWLGGAGESDLALPSPCLVVRPCVQTADSQRRILLTGPVVIDPVFSSAWTCLITFHTPLPERNIRDVAAKKGLENF